MFREKGFSILEILITLIVLGILTFLAIKGYLGYVEQGKVDATIRMIGKLQKAVDAYSEDTGYYPANTQQLWENALSTDGWDGPYVRPPFDDPTLNEIPKTPYGGKAYIECSDGNYIRLAMEMKTPTLCKLMDEKYDDGNLNSGRITYDENSGICYYYFGRGSYIACK